VAGLLAVARVALALAGLDVGTAFGGLGAAREMSFAASPSRRWCSAC
jgi:formate hydrogenlyase subunit 4